MLVMFQIPEGFRPFNFLILGVETLQTTRRCYATSCLVSRRTTSIKGRQLGSDSQTGIKVYNLLPHSVILSPSGQKNSMKVLIGASISFTLCGKMSCFVSSYYHCLKYHIFKLPNELKCMYIFVKESVKCVCSNQCFVF